LTAFVFRLTSALRVLISGLCALIFALCCSAEAQQPKKLPRIAFLGGSSGSAYASFIEAFRQGLRELGWIEGQNLVFELRYGEGKLDRLPDLAAGLVRDNVDVVAVSGARAVLEMKNATQTIPIIMTTIEDPVAMGIVQSLARPGKNITGLTNLAPELSGKRVELLKEIVAKLSRVAVLWPPDAAGAVVTFKDTQSAARTLGLQVQSLEVRTATEFDAAFRTATKERTEAIVVLQSALTNAHRKLIADLAATNRLPGMYTQRDYVEAGGLISYGVDTRDLYRRAAVYVDKVLKGANPAELPVEQPTKFELVVNLKTAKKIGLTVPQSVLYRADSVIR
jgi:putative ABC transport system substrate-binding protein